MNKNEIIEMQNENAILQNKVHELAEIADKYNNSIMAKLDNRYGMTNFGFEDERLHHEGTKYTLTLKSEDGKASIVSDVELSEKASESVDTIGALRNMKKTATIADAWNIAKLRKTAKNNGFKSVGEFVATQFPSIDARYANQLANTADAFLTEDAKGNVHYKYSWCEGVDISNLNFIMGTWNKYNEGKSSPDSKGFYDEYIKPDDNDNVKLPIRSSQNEIKKAVSALNTASGKSNRKTSKTTADKPEMDIKTCLANVVAWFEENNDIDDEQAKTYLDILGSIDTMIDRITKKSDEKSA